MSGVTAQGVTKSYGHLSVLKGIDLQVQDGEFVVLLGPSGCGKSTLLNVIAGLEDIESGRISIGGKDMTHADPSERGLAVVFQSYALFPTMTVRKNLSFGLEIAKTPKAEIAAKVAETAEMLQITHLLDRKPSQLSGGQRQRVAIGRALVRSTQLCLFDEPLSNLDAQLRATTRVELRKLHARLKSTMIYVTHDQIEAMTLANRVAVMNGGRIEQFDAPQAIYDKPETLFVAQFIGTPQINLVQGELRADGTFVSAEGLHADLSAYPFRSPPAVRTPVVFGVRPDEMVASVGPARPGWVTLQARQSFSEALGPRSLLWLDVGAERWSMYVEVGAETSLPQDLQVSFDVTKVSVFDQSTGKRL